MEFVRPLSTARQSAQEMPAFDPMRTLQRYQTAIRDHLQLKPAYSREARKVKVAVRKVFEAAQVMVNWNSA
jgi:hypothetical protein